MKRINITIIFFSVLLINMVNSYGQESKYITTHFQVKGVCNQCKSRIENAAYIKGVKHCEWDSKSEELTITYDSTRTEFMKIHESISNAGHTTDKLPANMEAYNKLPACCQYNSGSGKH
jgi:periplasmic mercuric ion binding protein